MKWNYLGIKKMKQGWNEFSVVDNPSKQHKCVWCKKKISIGERHQKFVGIYEGELQSWRIHLECIKPMDLSRDGTGEDYICEEGHCRGGECQH